MIFYLNVFNESHMVNLYFSTFFFSFVLIEHTLNLLFDTCSQMLKSTSPLSCPISIINFFITNT